VTPAIFAGITEHAGYGYGFLYLAGCALVVAVGVGTVLGDTLAKHDRKDVERRGRARVSLQAAELGRAQHGAAGARGGQALTPR
jgi:hypothetical protein